MGGKFEHRAGRPKAKGSATPLTLTEFFRYYVE